MDLVTDWRQIRDVLLRAQRTGLHHAFATVGADGRPHVTPIGSLWLHPREPRGVYLDVFNRQLAQNLDQTQRVSILAVDASRSMWLRSVLRGRFSRPPGMRLSGVAGERRRARDDEAERIRRMFRYLRFTRGYQLLWSRVETVREVTFDGVEPVQIGAMTKGLAL